MYLFLLLIKCVILLYSQEESPLLAIEKSEQVESAPKDQSTPKPKGGLPTTLILIDLQVTNGQKDIEYHYYILYTEDSPINIIIPRLKNNKLKTRL